MLLIMPANVTDNVTVNPSDATVKPADATDNVAVKPANATDKASNATNNATDATISQNTTVKGWLVIFDIEDVVIGRYIVFIAPSS